MKAKKEDAKKVKKKMNRITEWIKRLNEMEERHCPDLDHKDCGELSDLLAELSNTINDLTLMKVTGSNDNEER